MKYSIIILFLLLLPIVSAEAEMYVCGFWSCTLIERPTPIGTCKELTNGLWDCGMPEMLPIIDTETIEAPTIDRTIIYDNGGEVPEFGVITAVIALIGAIGIILYHKRE